MRVPGYPIWVLALLALPGGIGLASEPPVPVALQMDLLLKVAAYDRNLPTRAGPRVVTLVVVKPGSDDSVRAGAQAMQSLKERAELGGLPHSAESLPYTGGEALAAACQAKRASIVYLAPGFASSETAEIGQRLEGLSVLSAGAEPSAVGNGVVLGFDLVSGKPKLVVSLAQAGKQDVALSSSVLKLMRVIP